ncbi:MAG TPA: thioredoxin family protein [Chitinophagales bacterium]
MAVNTVSDADFAQELAKNDKVIVKYYADWCGSCKLFSPKFKRLSGDERFANITFIEVNAEENEQARKAAGVDNLPFMATFKNGELVKGEATSLENVVVDMLDELN